MTNQVTGKINTIQEKYFNQALNNLTFTLKIHNKLVLLLIHDEDGCLKRKLNFSDPITEKAAGMLGYTIEDLYLKPFSDFATLDLQDNTARIKYLNHKKLVLEIFIQVFHQKAKLNMTKEKQKSISLLNFQNIKSLSSKEKEALSDFTKTASKHLENYEKFYYDFREEKINHVKNNLILCNNKTSANSTIQSPFDIDIKAVKKFNYLNPIIKNENEEVATNDKLLIDLFKFKHRTLSNTKLSTLKTNQFNYDREDSKNKRMCHFKSVYKFHNTNDYIRDYKRNENLTQKIAPKTNILETARIKINSLSQQKRCQCGIKEEKQGIAIKQSRSMSVLKMKSIIFHERQKLNTIKLKKKKNYRLLELVNRMKEEDFNFISKKISKTLYQKGFQASEFKNINKKYNEYITMIKNSKRKQFDQFSHSFNKRTNFFPKRLKIFDIKKN